MTMAKLIIVAIGLSMDAFAVAITKGIEFPKVSLKKMLIVGLYFGIFQGVMPLFGYLLASQFASYIISYDHYISLILLTLIGGKMIYESLKKEKICKDRKCSNDICIDRECPREKDNKIVKNPLAFTAMLALAIATSIDAMAVGVTFAFLYVNIWQAALLIGIITFCFSMLGVFIGNKFGVKFKNKAEFAGGLILILIGIKILLEHLNILTF